MPRSRQWMDLYQIWFRVSSRGRNQLCGIFVAVGSWVSILWGVKIHHLPLTWLVAVNTVLALPRSLWYMFLFLKSSPDGASSDWGCGHLIAAYYSFTYPERMTGWVGLVGWPTADGLPTLVLTRQLQSTGRAQDIGKVRWSKTNILSLYHSNNRCPIPDDVNENEQHFRWYHYHVFFFLFVAMYW